ncbi:MAG: VCBS repeat-containing protein [Thermoanaerobaculia bacterium]|nr:VCBS repeat-containing protein [Thermoanaerobaculia bacterium]
MRNQRRAAGAATFLILCFFDHAALAEGGVRFHDVAAEPGSGIGFERVPSARDAIFDALKQEPFFIFPDDAARAPHKPRGAPGVAIFDYDRDGDLDLYVTNGPGAANALYANQLAQTGRLGFVDVAVAAGVAASDQDSSGVCFGDIDNDGDHDLMVLGSIEPNRLFENRGDGTFRDITQTAGVGGGELSSSSCAMGDVDGDGRLDLFVANTHTSWVNQFGIVIPFVFNEHNQLYLNTGGNVFRDVSDSSGIENQAGFPAENAGAASLTWAVAIVDYDLDGDADILTFDDQGVVPHPSIGGLNYGIIHLFDNDGSGAFTDRTVEADLDHPGNWMGVSFGDFDCNGRLDFFATNVGDYPGAVGPAAPYPVGTLSSKWYLQQAGGSFVDPGLGALKATVFGWGTSAFDYDNDGDTDVFFSRRDRCRRLYRRQQPRCHAAKPGLLGQLRL